jgi:hypothetical protein
MLLEWEWGRKLALKSPNTAHTLNKTKSLNMDWIIQQTRPGLYWVEVTIEEEPFSEVYFTIDLGTR